MIYLYAIAEELDGLPEVRGVDGAPLARRSVEGLDLVVSEHGSAELDASQEAVLAHARVVEGLVERSAALLPARFGRGFRDEEALREAIAGRVGSLREALAQVSGCVEIGVRVVAPEPAPPPAESGRAYMEARLARNDEAERLAAAALAAQANPPQPPEVSGRTDEMVLNGAYLVAAADRALADAVAELEATYGPRGVSYELTGPWPPYNFVPRDLAET